MEARAKAVARQYLRKRLAWLSLFAAVLSWSYYTQALAQRSVRGLAPVLTEEGQLVVFERATWQHRELAKRLPLSEPWPSGGGLAKALARFGSDQNMPPPFLQAPAQILPDVYLIGQDIGNNLTYMIDCGADGVAIIDPSFDSEFEKTVAQRREMRAIG